MHDRDTQYTHPNAAPIEREPIDPAADAITDVREIRRVAYEAGELAGYERGQAAAQTMIDAATAEQGAAAERARIVDILDRRRGSIPVPIMREIVKAIRSGEAAP